MNDWVFVYGTLKRGGANHPLIRPFVITALPGWVPGQLLDLGGYPGWVHGEGKVSGELLRLRSIQRALLILDRLEDFHGPGNPNNTYERVTAQVQTTEGPVRAWCYRYVGSPAGARVLAEGDWPI